MKRSIFNNKIFVFILACLLLLGGFNLPSNKKVVANAQSTISLSNLVVSVGFKGSTSALQKQTLENTYNLSPNGVKSYFSKVSKGSLNAQAYIPTQSFVELDITEEKLLPKYEYIAEDFYAVVNENGYDNRYYDEQGSVASPQKTGVKQHIDGFLIEQSLVREVCLSIANGINEALDGDQNGIVDNVTIIIENTSSGGWGQILWSHLDYLVSYNVEYFSQRYYVPDGYEIDQTSFIPVLLNGAKVSGYTILPLTSLTPVTLDENNQEVLNVGEIAHEFYHVLGVQDYYPYQREEQYPDVGEIDILGSPSQIPQYPLSYTAQKLNWLSDGAEILPIEQSGDYLLSPTNTDSTVKAYKLLLKDYAQTGEYFMIEARSYSHQVFNQTLFGTGLVVYRVNTKNGYTAKDGQASTVNYGNMYNQEVYVFRLGGEALSTSKYGGVSYALLNGQTVKLSSDKSVDKSTIGISEKSGYSTDNAQNYLKTPITYSNGDNTGVVISNITVLDNGQVSFKIDFDDTALGQPFSAQIDRHYDGVRLVAKWQSGFYKGKVTLIGFDAEGLVKYKNGKYVSKKMPTLTQLEGQNIKGKTASFVVTTASSFAQAFIPSQEQMTAVYAIYENGQGNKTVHFVGVLSPQSPTFMQYLLGTTRWVVSIIVIVGLCATVLVVGILLMLKKEKQNALGKTEEEIEKDLEEKYGENYWLEDQSAQDSEDLPTENQENQTLDDENAEQSKDGAIKEELAAKND